MPDTRQGIERPLRLGRKDLVDMSVDDVAALIHELQMHQLELDMQNEELRRKERELGEARDYLAELFERAPVAYLTTDREGTLREANLAALPLLGAPHRRCLGRAISQYVHADDRAILQLHWKKLAKAHPHEVLSCQLRLQREDGALREVRMETTARADTVHLALVDETRARRAEAALRALTETLEERVAQRTEEAERRARELAQSQERLRAREAELRQAQKMHAIGRLASGVAHEFNNLLMGIIGSAEMCLDAVEPGGEVAALLGRLRESAVGGAEIVQQLMVFGRKGDEGGSSRLDELLQRNEKLLRKTVGEDVDLRLLLGAPDAHVPCSSVRIGQILMNLVMNARQAMPRGGKLTVHTQRLSVGSQTLGSASSLPPGEYALIRVCDTGVGMDEETQSRAFEPFFTTKPVGEGTGIGLSTVYGIAARAGGRVLIDSELGLGTVVTVVLPVVPATSEAAAPSVPPAAPDLAGRTVLIVEDEELVRETLRHYLESAGMRVLEAADGEEALELYRKHEPSIALVVTDISLPKIQGDELARQFTKPVVFVSAYATADLRRRRRLPPGARALQKPFGPGALVDAVSRALRS